MKRSWFRDDDGTYYRNCPLIMKERQQAIRSLRLRRARILEAEWREAWRKGLIRKDKLGRGDIEVQRRSFREAYPDRPELWVLDEP